MKPKQTYIVLFTYLIGVICVNGFKKNNNNNTSNAQSLAQHIKGIILYFFILIRIQQIKRRL